MAKTATTNYYHWQGNVHFLGTGFSKLRIGKNSKNYSKNNGISRFLRNFQKLGQKNW